MLGLVLYRLTKLKSFETSIRRLNQQNKPVLNKLPIYRSNLILVSIWPNKNISPCRLSHRNTRKGNETFQRKKKKKKKRKVGFTNFTKVTTNKTICKHWHQNENSNRICCRTFVLIAGMFVVGNFFRIQPNPVAILIG